MSTKKIAYGKPRSGSDLLFSSIYDTGDRTPLLNSFFDIPLPLEKNSSGNCLGNQGCCWILLNAFHDPAGFTRIVIDGFGCQSFHKQRSLFTLCLDFTDDIPGVFSMFSG